MTKPAVAADVNATDCAKTLGRVDTFHRIFLNAGNLSRLFLNASLLEAITCLLLTKFFDSTGLRPRLRCGYAKCSDERFQNPQNFYGPAMALKNFY